METNDNFFDKAFMAAKKAGIIHNRKDFARLVGVDRTTLYRQNVSSKTIQFVEKILNEHGVFLNGDGNEVTQNNTPETETTSAALIAEMQAQREMYDKHLSEALRIISKLTDKNG